MPFAAAVEAGVAAVMTSHLLVPALDPDLPATLSPRVLALLRDRLGFTGAIVTDALDMAGASRGRGIPEAAVLSLLAGADLLCLGADKDVALVREVQAAVVAAVGRAACPRLASSRPPPASTRCAAGPSNRQPPSTDQLAGARRAVTVEGVLPDLRGAAVVSVASPANIAVGEAAWGLPADGCLDPGPSSPTCRPATAPLVVQVRDAHRRPEVGALLAALEPRPPGRGRRVGLARARTTAGRRGSARAARLCPRSPPSASCCARQDGTDDRGRSGSTSARPRPWASWSTSTARSGRPCAGRPSRAPRVCSPPPPRSSRRCAREVGEAASGPVGVGVPGLVDTRCAAPSSTPSTSVSTATGCPSGRLLAELVGVPVLVENDVNAATLGAVALSGADDLVYLSIGTGLAAGLVLDGRLRRGDHGAAGEIGHVPVDPSGALCSCGQRGCLETVASGSALAAAWPSGDRPAAQALFAAAAAGDREAVAVRDRFAAGVAEAVRVLSLSVDPRTIVLGGGVAQLGEPLLTP